MLTVIVAMVQVGDLVQYIVGDKCDAINKVLVKYRFAAIVANGEVLPGEGEGVNESCWRKCCF